MASNPTCPSLCITRLEMAAGKNRYGQMVLSWKCPTCGFDMPASNIKIEQVWAYVAVDPNDGNEGIPAVRDPDGNILPLVGADEYRMKSFIPHVQQMVKHLKRTIKLVKFSNLEIIEEFKPEETAAEEPKVEEVNTEKEEKN